jgi:hypothetical protein
MSAAATATGSADPHAQLRRLYLSLLEEQDRFDEFKRLLTLYRSAEDDTESAEARGVRDRLNARIAQWLDGGFDGLSATQVSLWRSIVVEERINTAPPPDSGIC